MRTQEGELPNGQKIVYTISDPDEQGMQRLSIEPIPPVLPDSAELIKSLAFEFGVLPIPSPN